MGKTIKSVKITYQKEIDLNEYFKPIFKKEYNNYLKKSLHLAGT